MCVNIVKLIITPKSVVFVPSYSIFIPLGVCPIISLIHVCESNNCKTNSCVFVLFYPRLKYVCAII